VLAAFGAKQAEAEHLPGSTMWRYGNVVLRPVTNAAQAAWVAKTLDGLEVPSVRVGHPLRSTDGRWVIGGWAAMRYLEGHPEPRHDETVAVSVRLHQATYELPQPKFLAARQDAFAVADRVAWDDEDVTLAPHLGGRLFDVLAGARKEVEVRPQLVHADLFGNVLFHSVEDPAIVDFVPYWRPAEWAAGVAVVDALAWGGADTGLIDRWAHLPEWPQMLLRALLFRLAGHALHPHSTSESLRGIESAAHKITEII
jgi:uncharacterized protein (TIGR02569 family)